MSHPISVCVECGATFSRKARKPASKFCSSKCYRSIGHILRKKSIILEFGCWEWIGWKDKDGYGVASYRFDGTHERRARRIAWIVNFGSIPKRMLVCHRCDNPSCVNPQHLFLGSNQDNVTDMMVKGRNKPVRGEQAKMAKLSEKDVLKIRALHEAGFVQRRIAEQFGVGFQAINKIVLRQRWVHL